jgi:hypothetical protein
VSPVDRGPRRQRSTTSDRIVRTAVLAVLTALVMATAPQGNADEASADGTVLIDGLMWAVRGNGEDVLWQAASDYCETLELAGYTDWRLPTLGEIESVYEPGDEENRFIRRPLVLEDCCLWSSTSLADFSAEEAGVSGGQGGNASGYFWGFFYASGARYYSITIFPDGQAHCVRDP